MPDHVDTLPVWVINLDRSPERMARMDMGLQAQGLVCRRISAIDGRAEFDRLAQKIDRPAYERNMGQELLPVKVGCYFSHLAAWQLLVDYDQEMALILEDDVVFHADFRDALTLATRAIEHWDILRLNRAWAKLPVCQGRIGPYRLNTYIGPCTGNGAYLIRRATARKLLDAMMPQTRATDQEINRFFVHNFYLRGLEPFPSHVEDFGDSQITGRNHVEVKKPAALHRLPYYGMKASNYLRRLLWVLWRGEIWPKGRTLIPVIDAPTPPSEILPKPCNVWRAILPMISISSRDLPIKPAAMIYQLGEIWREQGHQVQIARDFHPAADLCILHHDRTCVSPADIPAAPAKIITGVTFKDGIENTNPRQIAA